MKVHIKRFTSDALGLTEGKAILIPFVLTGEEVEISTPFKKKDTRFAEPLKILQASPERIQPFCPHFGECGGCLTQHWDYQKELSWKEQTIQSLFKAFHNIKFLPILGADKMEHWRNKMEFTFSSDKQLGLYRFFGKREVFQTTHCSLGPPWFQEAVNAIRNLQNEQNLLPFDPETRKGQLRHLTLRHGYRTDERLLFLTITPEPWTEQQLEAFKKLGDRFNASTLLVEQKVLSANQTLYKEKHLSGSGFITEKLSVNGKTFTFQISPRAFFQPNPFQAEKVYQAAFDLLDLKGDELLLDLFAGTGTLGIFAAPFVKKVISIELSVEACMDARINRKLNGITNLEILQGDVGKILQKRAMDKPDVLLVDPPRAGLGQEAIKAILHLSPKKICYISCNPHTQAEDAKTLCEKGYTLHTIIPIDQFPRSPHVENIALFTISP